MISKNYFLIASALMAISAVATVLFQRAPVDQAQALPPTASGKLAPMMLNGGGGAPKTLDVVLSVVGTVEAGETLSVTAPFDAMIKEKNFSFDTEVSQGQLLLTLDTTELLSRLQEARVSLLKTSTSLQELENWEKSAEVTRAQRSLILAQQQVEQTKRKANETETLFKKGIIPRSEYDGLIEQLVGHQSQLAAALDDLKAVREKANKNSLEIARIEFAQAQAKYKELSDSLALERITAPRAGIITKAPASSSQAAATLEVGSRVTKDQLLFNIASTEKLWVSAKVDEADISELTPGMRAVVSIDTQDMLPVEGRLREVSAQAASNSATSRSVTFDIKIEMAVLNAEQRHRLRVGMSCNVSIEKGSIDIATNTSPNGHPPQ
jgi:multidrug efflux pump subunit AcrA (membrane-fusion protein)